MTVDLILNSSGRDRAAAETALKGLLEAAFVSDPGQLNVVLESGAEGYVIVIARAVFEHVAGLDYVDEVRATLRRAGVVVVDGRGGQREPT